LIPKNIFELWMSSDKYYREAAEVLDLKEKYYAGELTQEDRECIFNLAAALGYEVRTSQTMMPGIPEQDHKHLAKAGDYP